MKSYSVLILAAALVALSGCINLSFGSRRSPPPPPIVVPSTPLNPADSATLAEIDAAAKLSFDQAKKESLTAIAQRPGLSSVAQVRLVQVVYRSLSFEEAKVQVLSALIANPAFGDPARQAIVTQLDRLAFDAHRQEILRRLNQRVTNS